MAAMCQKESHEVMDVRRMSLGAVAAASKFLQSWHVCKTLTGEDSNPLNFWRLCVSCILPVARMCLIALPCLSRRITRPLMLSPKNLLHGTEAQNRAISMQELPCRLDASGAVGIARCFTYSGHLKRVLHAPTFQENIQPCAGWMPLEL